MRQYVAYLKCVNFSLAEITDIISFYVLHDVIRSISFMFLIFLLSIIIL